MYGRRQKMLLFKDDVIEIMSKIMFCGNTLHMCACAYLFSSMGFSSSDAEWRENINTSMAIKQDSYLSELHMYLKLDQRNIDLVYEGF